MKRLVLWMVFQCVITTFAFSQTAGLTVPPKLDTNYVRGVWDSWSLRVFGSRKSNQFTIRSTETGSYIRYIPNRNWAVGVGIAYKFILLDLGFALPISGLSTKRFDVRLAFKLDNHIVEVSYWRYKGFTSRDNQDTQYEFREDVRSQLFGINYYHNFNTQRVPFHEQANGTQMQRKSAGTFGFGGYWAWDQLKADSSLIPGRIEELFHDDARVHFASQYSLGVLAGYAFSLVLPLDLFFIGAVIPGTGINVGNIEAENTYNPPLVPQARINLRAAFGYMSDTRVYAVLSWSGDGTFMSWGKDSSYYYSLTQFKLVVGYRFTSEIGFLEKTADRLGRFDFN